MAKEENKSGKDLNPEKDKRFKRNPYYLLRNRDNSGGMPRKYSKGSEILDMAMEYFREVDDNPFQEEKVFGSGVRATVDLKLPYTLSGLYLYLGIDDKMFKRYEEADQRDDNAVKDVTDDDKSLALAARQIRQIIFTQKIEGATIGIFQHQIVALELGLLKKETGATVVHDSSKMSAEEVIAYNKAIEEEY